MIDKLKGILYIFEEDFNYHFKFKYCATEEGPIVEVCSSNGSNRSFLVEDIQEIDLISSGSDTTLTVHFKEGYLEFSKDTVTVCSDDLHQESRLVFRG